MAGADADSPEADPPDGEPGGVHPKHLAADRAGKGLLRAAHDITVGLAAAGVDDDGVVVLRRGGPHRSLGELEALLDEALSEEQPKGEVAAEEPDAEGR